MRDELAIVESLIDYYKSLGDGPKKQEIYRELQEIRRIAEANVLKIISSMREVG